MPAVLEAQNTGSGTGTSQVTGNIVTAQNTIIVGMLHCGDTVGAITEGANYTLIYEDENAANEPFSWVRRTTTPIGAGTYTVNWTTGSSGTWVVAGAAYKEAAADGLPPGLGPAVGMPQPMMMPGAMMRF